MKALRLDRCEGFSGTAFEGVQCKLEELRLYYCTGLRNIGRPLRGGKGMSNAEGVCRQNEGRGDGSQCRPFKGGVALSQARKALPARLRDY